MVLTGLERKQKAFRRTHPSVSSPGDSRRPKFLPKTHTCACVTASLAPASVLSSASPPSLFHSSLPCVPFLFLLRSCFLSSVSPHPTPCRLPSFLSPPPCTPHGRCCPRARVEECVFCFSLVPALPTPPADQERAELAAGRRHLEARQALYAELQTQLDNCPESVREQLQEQLRRVSFTSPPSLAPEGHPPGRQESGGTGPPGPCTSCRTHQGRCCGLEGTGKDWGDRFPPFCYSRQRCP